MLKPHKLALLLPAMTVEERTRLMEDIQANGLLDAITTYQGKVLDGRHRDELCSELGIEPRYVEYAGDDPVSLVVSRNLQRRQLTTSQRAAVAAELEPYFANGAKRRQAHGQTARGRTLTANRQQATERGPTAADEAAKVVGVGGRSVGRAKRVKEQDPELFEQVKRGEISVDAAEVQVRVGKKTEPKPKPEPKPKSSRRRRNWDGKTSTARERDARERLRALKQQNDYSKLAEIQLTVDRLTLALQDYGDIPIEDSDEATLAVINDLHDDLITMGEWHDRALGQTQAYLTDNVTRDKIRRLLNTKGRTPEEAATAIKLAERLQRKLDNRLSA